MASAKDLRKRIGSVKNTQQITRAMKMVSAAKLRRAQDAIVSLRPYANEISNVVNALARNASDSLGAGERLNSPLLVIDETPATKVLIVVVSSDRGLCGAFNANVIKAAQRFLRSQSHKYQVVDFAFIGRKAYEFFKNKKTGRHYSGLLQGMTFAKAQQFSDELIERYLQGEYDEIKFIYNEFRSAISQKVTVEAFLPLRPLADAAPSAESKLTLYEPSPQEILERILPKHFATQVLRILFDSIASEHGARMSSMENATKNAGEMIRKLTLQYNKTRQAGITKELLEIVSGSEAQNN